MSRDNSTRREQHVSSAEYGARHEAIFGSDAARKVKLAKERDDRARFVTECEKARKGPNIIGSMEPIKSPIDGTVISDRAALNKHMLQHGIADSRDYGDEFMAKRMKERDDNYHGRTQEAKEERVNAIKQTLRKYGYD